VHDAVPDCVGGGVLLDGARLTVLDEMPLEARRAGVDDEDSQRPSRKGGYSSRISSA
jgi:hypothetical protein